MSRDRSVEVFMFHAGVAVSIFAMHVCMPSQLTSVAFLRGINLSSGAGHPILAEGAIALSVTLSGGALFAS